MGNVRGDANGKAEHSGREPVGAMREEVPGVSRFAERIEAHNEIFGVD
ncbi:unnamed protein product [marine sediment metagenome]|uniref:Uncharacterized protein n=1 Tax=marine sediment metagenome TaxID=412755 RepID=X1UST7_9ZZZZ